MAIRHRTPPPPRTAAALSHQSSKQNSTSRTDNIRPFSLGSHPTTPRALVSHRSPNQSPLRTAQQAPSATQRDHQPLHTQRQSKAAEDQMSRRIAAIMNVPRLDARPEMYRVDVAQTDDLRRLHLQHSQRDPELGRPLVRSGDKNLSCLEFSDAGSSCGNGPMPAASQRRHVSGPPSRSSSPGEKRHMESPRGAERSAPWDRSSPRKGSGRATSPTMSTLRLDHVVASPAPRPAADSPANRPATPTSRPLAGPLQGAGERESFPATRGASDTMSYRRRTRSKEGIQEFERTQPKLELPPRRAGSATPRDSGAILSHLPLGGAESGTRGRSSPRTITVGNVTSPLNDGPTPRASSSSNTPGRCGSPVSSNPNTMSKEIPVTKRCAKPVPEPPGGRRGSSGIFDTTAPMNLTAAIGALRKSHANADRLNANTMTSNDNTLKSPSMQAAAAPAVKPDPISIKGQLHNSQQRRVYSSLMVDHLKGSSIAVKPDSVTSESPRAKHKVSSPCASQLRSSNQVSNALRWD